MSKKQIQGPGSAPGFAGQTGAPPICKSHERAHSKNTLDPAKRGAPDSGQTRGGSRQGHRTSDDSGTKS